MMRIEEDKDSPMSKSIFLTLAASSLAIGTLSGCTTGSTSIHSVASTPSAKQAPKYAKQAEKALQKDKVAEAVAKAELAVAAMPADPVYRTLLGKTYLAAGRFESAERSFMDAMELGDTRASVVLSLAMSQLGQGKSNKALTLVNSHRGTIPASDFGLALALAGDASQGVDVLVDAIRSDNMSARTRQNLALAYALDGRWREAKLMAMQDVQPAEVDARIMEWAQIARPGAYQARVASLLNVTPAQSDPGQPVQLALAPPAPLAVTGGAMSEADAAAETDTVAVTAAAELPAIGPAPRARVLPAAQEANRKVEQTAIPASQATPIIKAAVEPMRVPAKKAVASIKAPESKAAKHVAPRPVSKTSPATKVAEAQSGVTPAKPVVKKVAYQPAATPRSSADGTIHLVQLGAFSTPENAQRAWGILSARHSELNGFRYASSQVQVKGKTLYRLAAFGFGNAASAKAMCAGLKAKGGNCIVRETHQVAPQQMAERKATQVASR